MQFLKLLLAKLQMASMATRPGRRLHRARCSLALYKTFKVIKEGSQRIVENEPGDAQLRVSGGAALVGEKKTDQCHPTGAKLRLSTTFSNKVLDSTKSFTFLITKKEEMPWSSYLQE